MAKWLYHQIENTNESELSTYIYDYNAWEFNSPHFHKNVEILLIIKGTCECFIGEETYSLKQGDAIFIQPFQIHGFRVGEESVLRCVTFSELLILTFAKSLEGKTIQNPVFHPSEATSRYFLDLMMELFGKRSGHNKQLPPIKRMKTKGILYILSSEFLAKTELFSAGGSVAVAMDIVGYFSENFQKDISLHDIADAKGYNYQYLSRTFNKIFGIHFKKMLNQYRMAHAFALLVDSDLPITQIAFESGFQSIRSFDHVSREIHGKSPKEIRNSILETTNSKR